MRARRRGLFLVGSAAIGVAALLSAACGPQRLERTEMDVAAAISEALTRGDTATVRFFIEVPFAFSRLYIAAPGTPEQAIADALRSDAWRPELSRGIETAVDSHLLIFETRGKFVSAALPKSVADVAPELTGRMYGPNDAVFSVRRLSDAPAPILMALPARSESEAAARE